ncbi:MAG: YhbY family RNA-binding protein [Clostridia bacterium]|nr:YhbY family RNA-binding protein [Clostridia bacterium]
MITSKERAKLKSIVSLESAVCIIGKEGLSENCLESIEKAVVAREVVKINVLPVCETDAKTLANTIVESLECELIGVIGKKIIIYKFNKKNKKHAL